MVGSIADKTTFAPRRRAVPRLGSSLAALLAGMLLACPGAQAQISNDTVKVGVLTDHSGFLAGISGKGSVLAARMAVEDFGKTVLGKPIEVIEADHQNKPDIASGIANRWIDLEGVDMVTDLTNSSVALAVQSAAKAKNKIAITSGAGTTELTGKQCSPTGFHWAWDTYATATGTGKAVMAQGADTWFFITADYAFGHASERDLTKLVKERGGKVVGSVKHPTGTQDFASFLLQAQASKAKVIALANGGADTSNSVKQAREFGITQGGQRLMGLVIFISDVHAMGLDNAEGLLLVTGFYWDRTEETRAWSKRFMERMNGAAPTMVQAGVYSSTMHYLKAVQAAGTDDTDKVVAKMRELPVNDFFATNGKVREDGRMVHDMYLVEVKGQKDSKHPWDYYKVLSTIPGDDAFQALSESECPLVRK
jgi:branched-chain amino acid transport system substrate-binding protein